VETIRPAQQPTRHQNLANLGSRGGWTLLILATLYVCYFTHLGSIGLIGPDEARYAWIARDMAQTGDWVTPRLYGQPWFEKPPLYYWGSAITFKLFGVTETAARLPSAVSALLGTLTVAWLALRLYGSETARWLLLLLPTTVGMIGFSHAAATDMPFTGMLTVAMVAAAVLLGLIPCEGPMQVEPDTSVRRFTSLTSFISPLFGFFLGLAVLAKGPVAIVLCGGPIFFWALFTKHWRDARRVLHPAGIASFFITSLPWYVLCARHNPDFLRVFFIEHNFKRFLTPEFQHIQPFWFYAEIILIGFLPWTASLLWALIAGCRRWLQTGHLSAPMCFLLCWCGFCAVFFTVSRSKLPGYILPAFPAIGLILSRSATGLVPAKRWSFGLASLAAAVLFGSGFVAILRGDVRLLKNLAAFAPLFGVVLLFFAVANLLLGGLSLFKRRSAAVVAAGLSVLLTFALMDMAAGYTPVSILSPRYVADQIRMDRVPVSALRVSRLRRATLYGLNFYLRTDLQEWDGDPSREVYVLAAEQLPCSKVPQEMSCSDLWGWIDKNDQFDLLHLIPKR
jgi:4-amino-4-deoxy-L-arabinose transferase-like glycosyltransferase